MPLPSVSPALPHVSSPAHTSQSLEAAVLRRYARISATRRVCDVLFVLLTLPLSMPLLLFCMALVRLADGQPVFYKQERVGSRGRTFRLVKLRTMRLGAEDASGPVLATPDDRRLTPVGTWLRRTRFDELPQLWHVLRGQMTLIGPRPERPFFVEQILVEAPALLPTFGARPGLTGLPQVRYGYAGNLPELIRRSRLDLWYLRRRSLRLDLYILAQTLRVVLLGRGR